jgi:hypothetical protein
MSSSMPSEVLSLCNAKNIKKPTQTPFDWLPLSRFYFLTQKSKKRKRKRKRKKAFSASMDEPLFQGSPPFTHPLQSASALLLVVLLTIHMIVVYVDLRMKIK